MRTWRTLGIGLVVVLAVGCSSKDDSASTIPSTPSTTVAPVPSSAVLPPVSAAPSGVSTSLDVAPTAVSTPATFVMPDEVGKGLQEAQDDIQRLSGNPLFITRSSDASGKDRRQILDRNWVVCSQNIPAGTEVSTDNRKTEIIFATVKIGERCP